MAASVTISTPAATFFRGANCLKEGNKSASKPAITPDQRATTFFQTKPTRPIAVDEHH
jgi:hypothetical protein